MLRSRAPIHRNKETAAAAAACCCVFASMCLQVASHNCCRRAPYCLTRRPWPALHQSSDASVLAGVGACREKCVARMRSLRLGLDVAGASAPGASEPRPRHATAPLRSHEHGWQRRTDDGISSTDRRASWREDANAGVSKQRDRDRYLPRIRKPRVESYEVCYFYFLSCLRAVSCLELEE